MVAHDRSSHAFAHQLEQVNAELLKQLPFQPLSTQKSSTEMAAQVKSFTEKEISMFRKTPIDSPEALAETTPTQQQPSATSEPSGHLMRGHPLVSEPAKGSNDEIVPHLTGPYVVIAENFAPGTTAADIESFLKSIGCATQSCRMIRASPTVIAEMVFAEEHDAEFVISSSITERFVMSTSAL